MEIRHDNNSLRLDTKVTETTLDFENISIREIVKTYLLGLEDKFGAFDA